MDNLDDNAIVVNLDILKGGSLSKCLCAERAEISGVMKSRFGNVSLAFEAAKLKVCKQARTLGDML